MSTRTSPVKVDFTPFRLMVVTGISTGNPGSRGFGRKPTFENEGPIPSGKSSARLFTTLVGMPNSVGFGKCTKRCLPQSNGSARTCADAACSGRMRPCGSRRAKCLSHAGRVLSNSTAASNERSCPARGNACERERRHQGHASTQKEGLGRAKKFVLQGDLLIHRRLSRTGFHACFSRVPFLFRFSIASFHRHVETVASIPTQSRRCPLELPQRARGLQT